MSEGGGGMERGGGRGLFAGASGERSEERRETERENLGVLWRLVVKALLEMVMQERNRLLAPDARELVDAFVLLERVLRHGLRPPPLVSLRVSPEAQLWALVQRLGAQSEEAGEAVACVSGLAGLSTPLSRVRAWLRLGLMQKKLGDYVGALVEARALLKEHYEDWAFLRSENAVPFAGSLLGLRVIDCNLYLTAEELAAQPIHVRLAHYIRLPTLSSADDDDENPEMKRKAADDELKTILDQKNFLEEHNLQLQANIVNLEKRIETLERIRGFRPSTPLGSPVKSQNEPPVAEPVKRAEEVVKEVGEEASASVEEEIQSLRALVLERQDSLVAMRAQMEDVKRLNHDLYTKLREADETRKSAVAEAAESSQLLKEMEAGATATQKGLLQRAEVAEEEGEGLRRTLSEMREELSAARTLVEERGRRLEEGERETEGLRAAGAAVAARVEELESELGLLRRAQPELLRLRGRESELEARLAEYERTLVELGVELSGAKLASAVHKEGLEAMADAAWERDEAVKECKTCAREFGVARRRHHCRNCGGIFCAACSEQTMPLPSFPKPVRVCDSCYSLLLARFSKPAPMTG